MNTINFHVTNSCNYRCTYCFGKFPDKTELTFEQACIVIDNIANYFSKNGIKDGRINLAGGEPLLYRYLDDIIEYINAYGIKVSVITNGSLLTEERIALWKDKVYCIGLSVDTALAEINEAIGRCCKCKTIPLKQLIRITQAIHRNDIKLKINTVVSKLNVNEDMTELYKRIKPDRLKLLQMELVDGVNDCAKNLTISKKAFDGFCKRHKNCCRDTVFEYSSNMENSYLMTNPQGEFQPNNGGKYEIYGNCLEENLEDIIIRVPISIEKFNSRYSKVSKALITDKKVIIFGGHPTWVKVIKERLLNAKFFKDGNLHSLGAIRNADEIWIQPNAISHSFYGKIMDAARLNGIPVRYFSFAGTKKCLEQVFFKESS
ncbi:MAG: viperin family antiviral radical SAM protein [Corallococcus sp.]|nr:viperin family antiviral radical SAM protein [Corallococcus sp.]MCM1359055.1 viperin family antiviral radical SAM protein [Corallococcus sp.]MCM1395044.1 viperin family antiviral radical SAM protein [Corallococcus sp.]